MNGCDLLRRFFAARSGGIAVVAAVGLPALLIFAVGAIELQQVLSDRSRTQDVADAAALQGAQQLGVTPNGATDRAKAFASAQLTDVAAHATITVDATSPAPGVMKVSVESQRMSFFGDLLPPGGFHTHADATAKSENFAPLCVLAIGGNDDAKVTATSKLEAGQCMVHANRNLQADPGAAVLAGAAEAVNTASGPIAPTPNIGAATIQDPFAQMTYNPPSTCNVELVDFTTTVGLATLLPGLHCGDVKVGNNATLKLAAGEHWFKGKLNLNNKSGLDGTAGAVLIFLNGSQLSFAGNQTGQTLAMTGAKTGPWAGFVLVGARDFTADFNLNADGISQLTGTVYLPNAKLRIDGTARSAQGSPWTVVAAKGIETDNGADLVINSNYNVSDVPVPVGVGNKTGSARLTH